LSGKAFALLRENSAFEKFKELHRKQPRLVFLKLAGTVTVELTERKLAVGNSVGILVGLHVGGFFVGFRLGCVVGMEVGDWDGAVGVKDGLNVGE